MTAHAHVHGANCAHGHHDARPGGAHAAGDGGASRLRAALVLTAAFLVAEVVGGLLSNSLALLADAGHMLTDVGALALSLFVAWFSRQPATDRKSFGYLRWEILAAFVNGGALLAVSALIVWEAIGRFRAPEPVATGLMLAVALGGLAVNAVSAWLLHPGMGSSLNMRAAYLHVLGDLLGSVATVIAALAIRWTGWQAADPVASVLTTLLIVRGAWRLVRESTDILLEATPAHIAPAEVRAQLEAIPGVASVHDLHVWTVASGMTAMSAHAVVPDPDAHQHVLEHVHDAMRLFGIEHVTVQLERRDMAAEERFLHA